MTVMDLAVTLCGVPEFLLTGEPLAVDLVNTVVAEDGGGVRDLLADERALTDWLALHEPELGKLACSRPSLDDVIALREALRALLQAATEQRRPPPRALNAVNAAAADGQRVLRWRAAGPRREWQAAAGGADRAVLGAIAQSGIELLAGHVDQLRRCGGPGCLLFFVATNPRRRWCSDRLCGNRVRVSRHRHRHAGA
jgi:predicted RNA-binding Zn ribbon-like protein